jgi:hypothetical protein
LLEEFKAHKKKREQRRSVFLGTLKAKMGQI